MCKYIPCPLQVNLMHQPMVQAHKPGFMYICCNRPRMACSTSLSAQRSSFHPGCMVSQNQTYNFMYLIARF